MEQSERDTWIQRVRSAVSAQEKATHERDAGRVRIKQLRAEVERLQAIECRAIDGLRGNASETDEYERGWLDACAEILGKRP